MELSWRIRSRLRIAVVAVLLGVAAGVLILFPINEFVYYSEYRSTGGPAVRFAVSQLQEALRGQRPKKLAFYGVVGAALSLCGAAIYVSMVRRSERIRQLSTALEEDVRSTIARGESATLEFKSTFRWDLREGRVNRLLETVVLKLLAGFMKRRAALCSSA